MDANSSGEFGELLDGCGVEKEVAKLLLWKNTVRSAPKSPEGRAAERSRLIGWWNHRLDE